MLGLHIGNERHIKSNCTHHQSGLFKPQTRSHAIWDDNLQIGRWFVLCKIQEPEADTDPVLVGSVTISLQETRDDPRIHINKQNWKLSRRSQTSAEASWPLIDYYLLIFHRDNYTFLYIFAKVLKYARIFHKCPQDIHIEVNNDWKASH